MDSVVDPSALMHGVPPTGQTQSNFKAAARQRLPLSGRCR